MIRGHSPLTATVEVDAAAERAGRSANGQTLYQSRYHQPHDAIGSDEERHTRRQEQQGPDDHRLSADVVREGTNRKKRAEQRENINCEDHSEDNRRESPLLLVDRVQRRRGGRRSRQSHNGGADYDKAEPAVRLTGTVARHSRTSSGRRHGDRSVTVQHSIYRPDAETRVQEMYFKLQTGQTPTHDCDALHPCDRFPPRTYRRSPNHQVRLLRFHYRQGAGSGGSASPARPDSPDAATYMHEGAPRIGLVSNRNRRTPRLQAGLRMVPTSARS